MSEDRSRSRSRGRTGFPNTIAPNQNPLGTGIAPVRGSSGSGTDFPLRMLVSSEMVGAIIGRGGSTIRIITQATRARVDVHRKENVGSVEKAITIYGNPENCTQACKKILEVMSQESQSTNKGDVTLKILAHNSLIGRIIGKGGATIKKIMNDTETKINVSSVNEVSGLNIERIISIRGTIEGMSAAEALISNKLRTSYENDLQQTLAPGVGGMFPGLHPMAMMSTLAPVTRPQLPPPFGPQAGGSLSNTSVANYPMFSGNPAAQAAQAMPGQQVQLMQETVHMYIPNNAVGAVIGTKGSYIRNIIRFSGASVKIATVVQGEKSEQPNERQVTITGSPESQWKAQCMIFEKMREEGFVPPNEEPRLTVEISVPSAQVGRVIGKGGTNVRELQRLTGSIIKFPSEGSTDAETTDVHIYGTFYSVQSAQRRIRSMLTGKTN